MVANNPMATRSSLELMLEKLQQPEDHPKYVPPALPVRPVSRARLPRARKPLQLEEKDSSFEFGDLANKRTMKKDGMELFHQEESRGVAASGAGLATEPKEFDHFQKGERAEKGTSIIQKCYRSHKLRCCYKELRRGVTALQAFVRGENARRGYSNRIKRLRAIIIIQKQTRTYLNSGCQNRKHSSEIQPKLRKNETGETKVPYRVLVDLQKRVLRTEAKFRQKKEENIALKMQFQELEKKWQQHEERMRSMEKMWQDQFTYIQKCLAEAKKKHPDANITSAIPNGRSLDFVGNFNEIGEEQICYNLRPHEELHKLKLRFKAWKKDYKNKLREAQSMLKKLGNSEAAKRPKSWWGK